MTIRQKLLLTILTTSVLVTALLYTLSNHILLGGFEALESQTQFSTTRQVLNTLDQELDTFRATAADWAYWDDTFNFMGGTNPSFIENNLTAETLANLDLDMVLLIDSDGRLTYSTFYDTAVGITPAPFQIDNAVIATLLPRSPAPEDSLTGIMEIEGQLLLITSRYILDSHLNPTIRGTLIFGRYLNETRVAALAETLETNLAIAKVTGPELNKIATQLQRYGGPDNVLVRPLNQTDIVSYSLIQNTHGEPAYLLQVKDKRDIYAYGLKSIRYFVSSLVLIGVTFLVVMLLLINRLVLSRISVLNQSVRAIWEGKEFAIPKAESGADEVATFSNTLNALLAEITTSHQALERANTELEARVTQRTGDLEETNQILKREIYERQQIQAQLQLSRDQALEALQLKTQILANVSHDARTPLSVIILYAQMFQAAMYGELTDKQAAAVQTILTNAQKMLSFVNNLLQESQSGTRKKEQLSQEYFTSYLLLEDIETMFRPLAERKNLVLSCSVADDVPDQIYGDAGRLRQMINNLVDNAIKFTASGYINVKLYNNESPEQFIIEVSDSGIGISPDSRDKVFEAFWQADGSITRQVNSGVGLGLSIVRQLATLMGGTVSVEANTPAPGTTFKVALPYAKQVVPAQ